MALMLDPRPHDPRALDAAALGTLADAMAPHEIRTVAGLDAASLADALAQAPPPRRPVLRLGLGGPGDAATLVERAIAQLARAVGALWPFLWGGEDFSQTRDDALSHAHLPLRLAALAARLPALSRTWAQEIVPRLIGGGAPRLREPMPAVEWAQLALAFAPQGLVLAVPLDAGADARAFVAAVEWLAGHADAGVLVLADTMPADPAFERILYGARELLRTRFEAPAPDRPDMPDPAVEPPSVIALPETEGRPHPQSAAELKLYTLIQADAELRPLFAFNRFVPDIPLLQAKADVLWAAGRLVVEIDGPEHRGAAKYRADRDRDYRLMLAGYRVLRMTNEDILTDAALALAKVRDMVRLVEGEAR